MAIRKSRADLVKELFALSIKDEEAAYMYLGYSGVIVRMESGIVAFDVANLLACKEIDALESLGILFFTHGHGDHYKFQETIEIFKATGTHIVAESSVAQGLQGEIPRDKLTIAVPAQTYNVGDFKIRTVSGVHRGPINLYQAKKGKLSLFHAGDSGYVPLKGFEADLAFLPTGSPSPTASPEHAYRMTLELKPKVAVAIHGSPTQSREFQRKVIRELSETTVVIPEAYIVKKTSLKR